MAPDVTIRAYRALQLSEVKDGKLEPLSPTISAIRQAIADKVDVLNISQSAPSDDPRYRAAIEDAIAAGIVVVAAAGNGGGTAGPSFPAAYPGVIAVGMSDQTDAAVAESQYDKAMPVSVAAPGKNLMALLPSRTSPGLAYDTGDVTGTSFATPLVTGVVAMILQRYPKLTPAQVKHRLEASADPPAGGIPDKQLGHGIVNPYRALTLTISDESATPVTATPVTPPLPEDQRPQPDLTVRNTALVVAAIVVAGTLLGVVIRFALPAARRRGFRPATPERSPERDVREAD
jgi:subtilisin family serine protease